LISEINALEQTRNLFKGVIEEFKSDFRDLLKSKNMAAANKGFVNGAFSIELNPLLAAAIFLLLRRSLKSDLNSSITPLNKFLVCSRAFISLINTLKSTLSETGKSFPDSNSFLMSPPNNSLLLFSAILKN
jgi:hypothetical protein